MSKTIFLALIILLFIQGCQEDDSIELEASIAEPGIQSVTSKTTLITHQHPFTLTTHLLSEDDIDALTLHYYPVSEDGNKTKVGDEELLDDNLTEEFIPKEQYAIGVGFFQLTTDDNYVDLNLSISSDIPSGHYHLAAAIDPIEHNDTHFTTNTMFISENAVEVDALDQTLDIEILDASLEDDILIMDDAEDNQTLYLQVSAESLYHELNQTRIDVCLEFDGTCYDMRVHKNEEYVDTNGYETIPLATVPTYSALIVTMSHDEEQAIFDALDEDIHPVILKILLTNTTNEEEVDLSNNGFSVPITIYKSSANQTSQASKSLRVSQKASTVSTQTALKNFSKSFNVTAQNSKFGVALKSNAEMVFGTLYSFAEVNGDLKVRVLGKDFSLASLNTNATATYASFDDTGYDIRITALGKNIFASSKSMSDLAGYSTIDTAELNATEKATLSAEEQQTLLAERQIAINEEGPEEKSALEKVKEFSVEKSVEKEQVIMVSVVPVTFRAAATGSIGFDASIKLEGILLLHAEMGPTASMGGEASGGVGVTGFSAGVEADFTFIENDFRGESDLEFVFSGNEDSLRLKGILSENITNTFGGPNGKINLYAEYSEPKICSKKISWCVKWKSNLKCKKKKKKVTHYPCGIATRRPTYTIFKWDSGISKDIELLNLSQTLLNQKIY